VALAANATIAGRLEEAESLLADAERALAAGGDEPFEPSVGRHLSSLVNLRATVADLHADLARQRGDLERAAAFAKRSLASLSEDDQALHAVVRWQLAMVDWMRGRPDKAEPVLTEIVTNPFLQSPRPWYDLGRVQQVQGRLGAALQVFGRAVEAASEGGHPLPLAGIGHVGLADVFRERAELDAASEHATEAVALCRQLPYTQWLVAALTTLARVRQTAGDQAGAIAAMEEAAQTAPNPDIATDMLSAVGVQRARLALVQGRVADAARWVEQRGLRANDEPSYQREQEHLVLARVLLARELPDRALGLLERLHTLAVAQQRTGSLIEIQALQALALVGDGDEPGGVAALIQALKLAYPEGYVRVFADEGAPMAALLGRLIAAQRTDQAATHSIPLEYLGRLWRAFPQARPPTRLSGAVVPGLVEQLSDRESEVLALLAAGRSNQQIAEELVVALNTVKKHVTHILDKLGAANRTEAVTRARELGLLG
jgi:LuxR family maltose regulon positive regulatory protein